MKKNKFYALNNLFTIKTIINTIYTIIKYNMKKNKFLKRNNIFPCLFVRERTIWEKNNVMEHQQMHYPKTYLFFLQLLIIYNMNSHTI